MFIVPRNRFGIASRYILLHLCQWGNEKIGQKISAPGFGSITSGLRDSARYPLGHRWCSIYYYFGFLIVILQIRRDYKLKASDDRLTGITPSLFVPWSLFYVIITVEPVGQFIHKMNILLHLKINTIHLGIVFIEPFEPKPEDNKVRPVP